MAGLQKPDNTVVTYMYAIIEYKLANTFCKSVHSETSLDAENETA